MYRLSRVSAMAIFLVMYSISCFSHTITAFSETGDQSLSSSDSYFIVTAYYSPLPNQENYMTSTYEGDIRLNGSGIHGASGKEVFPGMIAAPKKYNFGTKIYIEGLGIGSVEDRGGAIVAASDGGVRHDRLDVWMGYGDEGRKRAIIWGARKVKGSVVSSESETTMNFSSHLTQAFFGKSIGPDSSSEDIKNLQKVFQELTLYTGSIDGKHSSIKDELVQYQLEKSIISSVNDSVAGYFGSKTIEALRKDFPNAKTNTINLKEGPKIEKQQISSFIVTNKNISDSSSEKDINELQKLLTHIKLYSGKIDGNYASVHKTLVHYQMKKKIIIKTSDLGAGVFGPKTRESIKKDFANMLSSQEKEAIKSISPIEIPLENISLESKKELIQKLQISMKSLNIYTGKIDGLYDSLKKSLVEYQLKKGIIKKESDDSAGYFGPKTRDKMKQDVREISRK